MSCDKKAGPREAVFIVKILRVGSDRFLFFSDYAVPCNPGDPRPRVRVEFVVVRIRTAEEGVDC